jgi:arsenate reductase (thioredoxin)
MAEGWARHLKRDSLQPSSAGTHPQGIDPSAVEVMREAGVDISSHRSKSLDDLRDVKFDYVVTVCDSATQACPVFPGEARIIHHSFDDPPALARQAASTEQKLQIYRRVRDEIRAFVQGLPQSLESACA